MQIPHETIQTVFRLDLLLRFLVVGIARFIERLGFTAAVLADYAARRVQNFNFHFLLRRFLHVVINDRAVWGILAGKDQSRRRVSGVHAIRRRGLVKMHVFLSNRIGELAQRRDIIKDPKRAPVRRHYQIVVLNDQVVNRRNRQIDLQRAPVRSVVERDIDAALGPGVEQTFFLRVFSNCAHKNSVGNSGSDPGPSRSVVAGLVNVGREIVVLMAVNRDVRSAGIVRRRFNQTNAAPFRKTLGRYVGPILPFIPCDLNQAIVGAGPDQAFRQG